MGHARFTRMEFSMRQCKKRVADSPMMSDKSMGSSKSSLVRYDNGDGDQSMINARTPDNTIGRLRFVNGVSAGMAFCGTALT